MEPHTGRRLTVYLTARDHVGHHTLLSELVARARAVPVAGLTVFRDASGFGESTRVHHPHLVGDDAPLRVVVVDSPERVERFHAAVVDLIGDAMVVIDDVEIVPPATTDRPPR
jgi:PII-like signaling protein